MRETKPLNALEIQVGGLWLVINDSADEFTLRLLDTHQKFCDFNHSNPVGLSFITSKLNIEVIDQQIPPGFTLAEPVCRKEIFEIEEGPSGDLVFFAPHQAPPRLIQIDKDFQHGEVIGDFSGLGGESFYPLQYIDIIIFSNWLAGFGDIILHAAGIAMDGKGYCFSGKSGAGKSTLSSLLQNTPGVTILGEDQVILRYVKGQFWIYGTPWHVDPGNCSPLGVPLEKLFFLKRHNLEMVRPLAPAEVFRRLLQSGFIPFYRKKLIPGILENLSLVSEKIPAYEMSYLLESDILSLIGANRDIAGTSLPKDKDN